ncbi:hypothetical protein NOC27_3440 [Nitrosococcus oceani AFC27]|nr:hypothetical protein NOC27_3440 [Nitrosococcus oceani AFC27]
MFLVLAKTALQPAGPFLGDGARQFDPLFFVLAGPALSLEIGPDIVFGGELPVLVGGIDGIGSHQSRSGPGKSLGLEDRVLETVALVEGIEAKMFQKTDPVDLELVGLGPELHRLYFLAPYDGPDVGPVHAHDTVLWFFSLMKISVLLGEHLLGRRPSPILVLGHRYRVPRLQPVHLAAQFVQ